MAKFEQIQTYARYINEENFQQILHNYRRLLLQIGLSINDVERWISGCNWSVDDSGIVSIESNYFSHNMLLELNHCRWNVRASIIIWTDKMSSYVKEPWVELFMIIKPIDQTSTEYDSKLENALWEIMFRFSERFQETGVYATNEMQDGEAFIGLIENREEKLWAFDRAIVPYHHDLLYQNEPEGFRRYEFPCGIGYIRESV